MNATLPSALGPVDLVCFLTLPGAKVCLVAPGAWDFVRIEPAETDDAVGRVKLLVQNRGIGLLHNYQFT